MPEDRAGAIRHLLLRAVLGPPAVGAVWLFLVAVFTGPGAVFPKFPLSTAVLLLAVALAAYLTRLVQLVGVEAGPTWVLAVAALATLATLLTVLLGTGVRFG